MNKNDKILKFHFFQENQKIKIENYSWTFFFAGFITNDNLYFILKVQQVERNVSLSNWLNLVISSNFCTNFYPPTGSVKTFVKMSRALNDLLPPLSMNRQVSLNHLLKVLPLIKNVPFLIITSFHLFLITPFIYV